MSFSIRHWMKLAFLICISLFICVIAGCGGSASQAGGGAGASNITTTTSPAGATVLSVPGSGPKPVVHVPAGPPPEKLVVKVLKEGKVGPPARWGDRLGVRFVGAAYRTRQVFEDRWSQVPAFTWRFGKSQVRKGWEIGLKGMRLGGRRELTLPSRLAYRNGALKYVVELIEIELPASS